MWLNITNLILPCGLKTVNARLPVAVWYDVEMREDKGKSGLKTCANGGVVVDEALICYDGLTSATKGPGDYSLDSQLNKALAQLPEGDYARVEASREVGGREVLFCHFHYRYLLRHYR